LINLKLRWCEFLRAQRLGGMGETLPMDKNNSPESQDLSSKSGRNIRYRSCELLGDQKSSGLGVVSILETRQSSDFSVGMLSLPKVPGGSCPSSEGRETIYSARFGIFWHFGPVPKLEGPRPSKVHFQNALVILRC
jgi:hypothetical protein